MLEDANVKLTRVVTDILGVSGRAIPAALIAGETDPERLADCTDVRVKADRADIVAAVHGRVTLHHRFLLELHPAALAKARRKRTDDDLPMHSFRTLLNDLGDAGGEHDAGRQWRRHLHAANQAHAAPAALLRALGGDATNVARTDTPKKITTTEPLAKRVIGRVFPCPRRQGGGRSAGGMQRPLDGSDRHRAREAGDTGVHGACLPVVRASAREEMRRISLTIRSSSRLFAIHSRYRTSSSSVSFKPTVFPRALRVQ